MTTIKRHQLGFAHIQLLAILTVVVLAAALTFWRINKTDINAHLLEGTELTEQEIIERAEKADFIDKDHDLIPLCNETFTTKCEDEKEDADFDNDGVADSKDNDDDNDDIDDDDDSDDDNDDINDDSEDDDDNDGIDDDEDSDDDNDEEDEDRSGSNSGSDSDSSDDKSDDETDDETDDN